MKTIPRVLVAGALALGVLLAPVGRPTAPATATSAGQVPEGAAILAIVGRQVAWLNLEAPRHRAISRIQTPANALDVTALPDATGAVVAVSGPFPGGTVRGADLLRLDLDSGETQPLLQRAEPTESLHAPAWWPDRTTLLFERQDLAGQPIGPPGQEVPRYPSRIERVFADGSGREVMLAEGRQPAPSPDGSRLVFARTRSQGTALLSMSLLDGALEVLVPEGQFADLAYPQVSPAGDQIAFMAPQSGLLGSSEELPESGCSVRRLRSRTGFRGTRGSSTSTAAACDASPKQPATSRRWRGRQTRARCSSTAARARSSSTRPAAQPPPCPTSRATARPSGSRARSERSRLAL